MSRHGYSDDCDDYLAAGRWTGRVQSAIRGKRGQAFLKDLADAMDAMPVKELIREELIDAAGQVCTIGVVCKARGIDVSGIDIKDNDAVGAAVNIAGPMAAEIEYYNDEQSPYGRDETPAERWTRMRAWVEKHIKR